MGFERKFLCHNLRMIIHSGLFAHLTFEDNFGRLVNRTIHHFCHRKHSSNNGAHVYEELENVFPLVGVPNRSLSYLVVEDQRCLTRLVVCLLSWLNLENFSVKKPAQVATKGGGHCINEKHRRHLLRPLFDSRYPISSNLYLLEFNLSFEPIDWMLNVGIRETPADALKVFLRSKGKVVNLERVV